MLQPISPPILSLLKLSAVASPHALETDPSGRLHAISASADEYDPPAEVVSRELETQLRAIVKIVDRDGGLERMRGKGAAQNIEFQVAAENLSGPASKWKPEQFFDTRPLEAALKELGRK